MCTVLFSWAIVVCVWPQNNNNCKICTIKCKFWFWAGNMSDSPCCGVLRPKKVFFFRWVTMEKDPTLWRWRNCKKCPSSVFQVTSASNIPVSVFFFLPGLSRNTYINDSLGEILWSTGSKLFRPSSAKLGPNHTRCVLQQLEGKGKNTIENTNTSKNTKDKYRSFSVKLRPITRGIVVL